MRATVRSIGAGVILFVIVAALAGPVIAADATASPSAETSSTSDTAVLSGQLMVLIAIVLIAAAVVCVAMVLWFTRDALGRYYSTAGRFARLGISTEPVEVTSGGVAGELGAGTEARPPISIFGPASATVGQAVTYEAKANGASVDVTWSVDPSEAGALNPRSGPKVQFVATRVGVAKILAEPGASNEAVIEVAVVETKEAVKLPFIGRGWGGIAVGLVAVFAVFGLGLAGRLGPEALATLFGGLLGVGAAKAVSGSSDKDES